MNYKPLGEIVTIRKGKKVSHFTNEKTNGGKRYIQIDDLRNNENLKYSSDNGVEVVKEDLIIVWDGANAGTIGFGLEGLIGSTLAVLKKNDNSFITPFIGRLLKGKFKEIQARNYGATIPHVKRDHLLEIPIPEFNVRDQIRITKILDEAETLKQKRKESIKLLDDYLRSTFLEMFGDPIVNKKGWDKDTLKSKIAFLTSGSRGWAKYYSNEGTLFLRIQNVGINKLILNDLTYVTAPDTQEAIRTKVQPRDLLLTITADLGRTAVVPNGFDEAHINQHLALVRLQDVNPYYISAYLSTEAGKLLVNKSNKGGVKAGLNFNDIKSLQILLPPLKLQDKYEEIYHQVEKLKAKYKESEKELDNLFGSLMQRAFKGEL